VGRGYKNGNMGESKICSHFLVGSNVGKGGFVEWLVGCWLREKRRGQSWGKSIGFEG